LAVSYSANGLQGEMFRDHGGHQIECEGRIPKILKETFCRASNNGASAFARKDPTLKMIG
jgi:hypothetical protein